MRFSNDLIEWYHPNKRDLPWRDTRNPYHIWISEIILQQTRVNQGLGYYLRFIETFPTIVQLANAPLDAVLKVWQGLGYYTRARNIHQTAKFVVTELGGVMPNSYAELIKLRGIGDYTAAAIAAFAFDEPVAAIDGNVYRIYSRVFGIYAPIDKGDGKKMLRKIAHDELDKNQPATFNQAIMDLGGQVCLPKNPLCESCPVSSMCYAFRNREVDNLPAKAGKTKVRDRYFYYLLIRLGEFTYIRQRNAKDIWHSLFEFPLIERSTPLSIEEVFLTEEWLDICGSGKVEITYVSDEVKHLLSHQRLFTRFFVIEMSSSSYLLQKNFMKVPVNGMAHLSTPRLIERFLAAEPAVKYFTKGVDF